MEAIIIKQILSFFGHIMRRDVSLEKAIMLGKCDGTRRRGRPRQRWLAGVVEATGLPLDKLKDLETIDTWCHQESETTWWNLERDPSLYNPLNCNIKVV